MSTSERAGSAGERGFVVVQANPTNPQWGLSYLTHFDDGGAGNRSWGGTASLAHVFHDRDEADATAIRVRSTYENSHGWRIEVRSVTQ